MSLLPDRNEPRIHPRAVDHDDGQVSPVADNSASRALRSVIVHNQLEPDSLIRHFRAHPPEGFAVLDADTPTFSARFDLLTTVEPAVRKKIETLPLSNWWRRYLHPHTCFVGTTVSEYALLPESVSPERLVADLLAEQAPRYAFLIIKDIPTEAVLVGQSCATYSHRLAEISRQNGFVLVEGQALAYVPIDFASIDEYLSRLSRTRRRDIRRKLKSLGDLDIESVPTGDARFGNDKLLREFHELYLNVYRQSEIHFDCLTPEFFKAVLQDRDSGGVVFTYRVNGQLIGYNLCFVSRGMLVDKYVGFAYPQARDHNLYAVSWFQNLQYALAHGLRYYVAGWTDPEVKRQLGARFTPTRHAVYVRNPVLRKILTMFKSVFESDHHWQAGHDRSTDS